MTFSNFWMTFVLLRFIGDTNSGSSRAGIITEWNCIYLPWWLWKCLVMTVITLNIPLRCRFTTLSPFGDASHIILTKSFLCKKNDLIESKSTSWKTYFKVLVVDHKMLLRILAVRTMLLLVVQVLDHDFFANGIIY